MEGPARKVHHAVVFSSDRKGGDWGGLVGADAERQGPDELLAHLGLAAAHAACPGDGGGVVTPTSRATVS